MIVDLILGGAVTLLVAVAEGRGKAQAQSLRRSRTETEAKLLAHDGYDRVERVPGTSLKVGDVVLVEAGDIIPSDGEIVEGIASVNEAAITGESGPVIRKAGGDRSAVTGGTQVLSDWIKVRITAASGSTFIDRMIALVEGAERQKTPNEIALTVLLAGLTLIFLLATATIPAFAAYAGGSIPVLVLVALFVMLIPTTIGALLPAEQGRQSMLIPPHSFSIRLLGSKYLLSENAQCPRRVTRNLPPPPGTRGSRCRMMWPRKATFGYSWGPWLSLRQALRCWQWPSAPFLDWHSTTTPRD